MGGRFLDYLAQGNSEDLPDPATMSAKIAPGAAAIYFANDTGVMHFFNEDGDLWIGVNVASLSNLKFQFLDDVDWTTPPTDGQLFKWDNVAGKIVPFTLMPGLTTEDVQDMIGAFITEGAGMDVVYDDAGNLLQINCTITQFTNAMADARVAAASVDALADVETSGAYAPTHQQVMRWDNVAGKWRPSTLTIASSVATLTDVDLTTPPTAGQALVWDAGLSKWKPGSVAAGGGSASGPVNPSLLLTPAPTLGAGFTEYGQGWSPLRIVKQGRMVTVMGLFNGPGGGGTIFTLPVGWRPMSNQQFIGACSGGSSRVNVLATTGDVTVDPMNTYIGVTLSFLVSDADAYNPTMSGGPATSIPAFGTILDKVMRFRTTRKEIAQYGAGDLKAGVVEAGDLRALIVDYYGNAGTPQGRDLAKLTVPAGKEAYLMYFAAGNYARTNSNFYRWRIYNDTAGTTVWDPSGVNDWWQYQGFIMPDAANDLKDYPVRIGVAGQTISAGASSSGDGNTRTVSGFAIIALVDAASGEWSGPTGAAGGGASLHPFTELPNDLTTWVNQTPVAGNSASAVTQSDGSLVLTTFLGNGTDNSNLLVRPLTSQIFDYTFGFFPMIDPLDYNQVGIVLRDSVSGKFVMFTVYQDSASTLWFAANMNSPTNKSGNVITEGMAGRFSSPVYCRVRQTATERLVTMGFNRHLLQRLNYAGTPSTFTTVNQIGLVVTQVGTNRRAALQLFYYKDNLA